MTTEGGRRLDRINKLVISRPYLFTFLAISIWIYTTSDILELYMIQFWKNPSCPVLIKTWILTWTAFTSWKVTITVSQMWLEGCIKIDESMFQESQEGFRPWSAPAVIHLTLDKTFTDGTLFVWNNSVHSAALLVMQHFLYTSPGYKHCSAARRWK